MNERPQDNGIVLVDGVTVAFSEYSISIDGIPSDYGSPYQLEYTHAGGDPHLRIIDTTFETFFMPIRFRTEAGGGALPSVADKLSLLPEAFMKHKGQIPPNIDDFKDLTDRFPSHLLTTVRVAKNPQEPRYTIRGLQDDDDIYPPTRFMDIIVAHNGNVTLIQREESEHRPSSPIQVAFYTEENGGKFPVMAAVLTNIAERLVRAKLGKK